LQTNICQYRGLCTVITARNVIAELTVPTVDWVKWDVLSDGKDCHLWWPWRSVITASITHCVSLFTSPPVNRGHVNDLDAYVNVALTMPHEITWSDLINKSYCVYVKGPPSPTLVRDQRRIASCLKTIIKWQLLAWNGLNKSFISPAVQT
jgi:hypothetical protein